MLWLISIVQASVVSSNIVVRQLENGVTIVVYPQQNEPLVAVQTWMNVGSRHETSDGTTGYAHFFEHLMFQGTEQFSAQERKKELMLLSADENAWTSQDFTCYHILAPADGVERILEIEADRFQNIVLTKEKVQREAGAVQGEYRKSRNAAYAVWQEDILGQFYDIHPYQHSVIGLKQDIDEMPSGLEKVQQFYQDHYRPSNTTIVVVGGVDVDTVVRKVEDLYGGWNGSEEPSALPPPEEPPFAGPKQVQLEWDRTPVAPRLSLYFRTPKPSAESVEYAALRVLSTLWSCDCSSLYAQLQEADATLVRRLNASESSRVDSAMFSINTELYSIDDANRVEEIIFAEIQALANMDPAALEQVKHSILQQQRLQLTSPDRWAFQLGRAQVQYGNVSSLDVQMTNIQQVSKDDIVLVATKYLTQENMLRATLTGAEQ